MSCSNCRADIVVTGRSSFSRWFCILDPLLGILCSISKLLPRLRSPLHQPYLYQAATLLSLDRRYPKEPSRATILPGWQGRWGHLKHVVLKKMLSLVDSRGLLLGSSSPLPLPGELPLSNWNRILYWWSTPGPRGGGGGDEGRLVFYIHIPFAPGRPRSWRMSMFGDA